MEWLAWSTSQELRAESVLYRMMRTAVRSGLMHSAIFSFFAGLLVLLWETTPPTVYGKLDEPQERGASSQRADRFPPCSNPDHHFDRFRRKFHSSLLSSSSITIELTHIFSFITPLRRFVLYISRAGEASGSSIRLTPGVSEFRFGTL